MVFDKKIFTCKDVKEIEEAVEYDIYRKLLVYSEKYGNYQTAVDKVQKELESHIKLFADNKDVIKRAADKAGERFLIVVGKAKKHNYIHGNITVKQTPPKHIAGEQEMPGEMT